MAVLDGLPAGCRRTIGISLGVAGVSGMFDIRVLSPKVDKFCLIVLEVTGNGWVRFSAGLRSSRRLSTLELTMGVVDHVVTVPVLQVIWGVLGVTWGGRVHLDWEWV